MGWYSGVVNILNCLDGGGFQEKVKKLTTSLFSLIFHM